MKKDVLQMLADATGSYVAFPKRWPDEDCATYVHLFHKEPHLDEDGEWTDDCTPQSVDISEDLSLKVRQIPYKESMRKPKVSSWETFINTGHFLRWDYETIKNLKEF